MQIIPGFPGICQQLFSPIHRRGMQLQDTQNTPGINRNISDVPPSLRDQNDHIWEEGCIEGGRPPALSQKEQKLRRTTRHHQSTRLPSPLQISGQKTREVFRKGQHNGFKMHAFHKRRVTHSRRSGIYTGNKRAKCAEAPILPSGCITEE